MLKKIDAYPVGRVVLCRWDFLSRRAMRPPEEGSDGAPVVEGVEEWAQAPNARTQVAASRADDRVLMDMWHLLRMIGGVERCRIDVS